MSSFFYNPHHQHHPFFDLFDQPQSSSHFYSPPDYSYQSPPSHQPHRQSAYHHDRPSRHHPLGHLHQQKLNHPFENYYSPQHLHYDGHHSQHPLHQLRQRKLDRDALRNQSLCYSGHPSSHRFPECSPDYEDSIRAERARRLAEAKRRHLGHSRAEDSEAKVQVTLPDRTQCVVPISWAKKMQSKYPGILTNSMIRPHPEPSESPVRLDRPLATNDSDHDDSDFYLLDPSQDPSVPVLTSSSPPTHRGSRSSLNSKPPQHSPEELDAAARLIQQQFRTHRSMKHLAELELTFEKLKTGFTYPSLLDLKFLHSPEQVNSATPSSTKLTFNHPVNRTLQAFEEGLAQLQIKADAILSRGNAKVKHWRKQLIKAIEAQLEQLDHFKTEAWIAQRAAHLENLAKIKPQADECEDVEMNDEIMNTDVESVSSDRFNVDSRALATPLSSIGEEPQLMKRQEEKDVIIPVTEGGASRSLETLVIPASSSMAANTTTTTPSAPQDMVSSASHDNPGQSSSSSCLVNPSVSSDGNLLCPAIKSSLADLDDILVSPV